LLNRLVELSRLAKKRVIDGYYDKPIQVQRLHASLVQAIKMCKQTPVITEIKYASPSAGRIRETGKPLNIAKEMLAGGSCALSILTDPVGFQGGLHVLGEVARDIRVPLIMKDIIVSPRQLRAAASCGADAVVLISELFSAGLADVDLPTMVDQARDLGLETLVEANGSSEFGRLLALKPDIYGINNRNLSNFEVDLETTRRVLAGTKLLERPVVSESGIETAADIKRLKTAGAHAFLIGTSIMRSQNVEEKVRELVNA